MAKLTPTTSLNPGAFRERLVAVAEQVLASRIPAERPSFDQALVLLDAAVREALARVSEVQLPWGGSPAVRETLRRRIPPGPEGRPIRQACERLWHLFRLTGLVAGRLDTLAARRRPTVADLTGSAWNLVQHVLDIQTFLKSSEAIPTGDLSLADEERLLIRNALLALVTSGLAFRAILRRVATLARTSIDWKNGVLTLSPGRGGAPQRYYVPCWVRLHLVALERFYETRGRPLRPRGCPRLLPPRWQHSERLARLLRRSRGHPGSRLSHRLEDFLAACRLAAALDVPPALAAFRAQRLLVAPADCDLTVLGLPLPRPVFELPLTRPRRQVSVEASPSPRSPGAPGESDEALVHEARRILRGLRAHTPSLERLARADALAALLAGEPGAAMTNGRLVVEYAVHVLRTARSSATARNRLAGLLTLIDAVTSRVPLPHLSPAARQDAYTDLIQACMRQGSQRAMRRRLMAWEGFLLKRGYLDEPVNWKHPELQSQREVSWQPVLLPGEVGALAEAAQAAGEPGLAAAVHVGAFAGPRSSELAELRVQDACQGHLGDIAIGPSKSDYSERVLPGRLLLPPSAWRTIEEYTQWRLAAGAAPTDAWLVDATGTPFTPDTLGQAFGDLCHRVLGRRLGLHTLRRTFGSGLLLRYLAATGQILPVSDGSALGAELVSAAALAAVRQAVELAATRAPELGGLWIIAALLGHASPEVSVSYYLTSLEWLQFLLPDDSPTLLFGIQAAARVLGLSPRHLQHLVPRAERPRGQVPLRALLALAADRIDGDGEGAGPQPCRPALGASS